MSKHTPWPWEFLEDGRDTEGQNQSKPLTICGPAMDDLASVYSSDDSTVNITRQEAVANARLIAAAPDLLDALSGLIDWVEIDALPMNEMALQIARAAIAKATGETA